jgi:hypothetical protein
MKKILFLIMAGAMCVLFQACAKEKGSGGFAVDGKSIDLPYGYCVKQNDSYRVMFLNHNKVTDAEMKNLFRETPADEVSISIIADKDPIASSILADNYRQLGIKISVDSEPKKPGDTIVVSVPEQASFKPAMGKFKDKQITVAGTFKARYCGETE